MELKLFERHIQAAVATVSKGIDWCIRVVTVTICLPFLLVGYMLGTVYTLTKEGWRIGRDI